MRGIIQKVTTVLSSRRFYWAVVVFFVIEALWITLSARYPMAFDEDFHLGVIRVYSEQLGPFLSGQPEGANAFGALAADPSYLYHYLMSFPYRFISLVTDNLAAQVIFLRVLNVAMITAGVVLFRKVLLRAGTSGSAVNGITLLFALVPTVPLLAGQINYDNLFMVVLAGTAWFVLRITEDLRSRSVNLKHWGLLAVLVLLASLVKYAFLPIVLAAVAYLTVLVCRAFAGRWHQLGAAITKGYRRLDRKLKVGLSVLLLVSGGLFMQRYGVNVVQYGHPVPDCDAVISVEACMEYGPFGRNYRLAAQDPIVDPDPIAYTQVWLQGLHYRLFFAVDGPPLYVSYPPAPLPAMTAVALFVSSLAALGFYWREAFRRRPFLVFLVAAAAVYGLTLWVQTYSQFLQTGQPVAINGRYFIPLLLPVAAVAAAALGVALRPFRRSKVLLVVAAILLFLQGGGLFSFILRSDASWYWPSQTVVRVNEAARSVLSKIMFVGPKHY